MPRSRTQGIETRHARACPARDGGECKCKPTYQASVWSQAERKRIKRTFPSLAAARSWRADAQVGIRKGTMRAPSRTTVREAAEAWLGGANAGRIRKRNGEPYKPSVLRDYEAALTAHVLPALGAHRLSEIRRADVQDFADGLLAEGRAPSTVRNAVAPLRAIYRRAVSRGDVAVNPTAGLELPAANGRRDRIASPDEADALLAALSERDRPLWATAFYAGLRAGELQALMWENVDLAVGRIRVERAYDPKARQYVAPKSRKGTRTVPLPAVLRDYLVEQRMRDRRDSGLVFGRDAGTPFDARALARRAATAWKRAGLDAISLHEARHTFASFMIGAGVNAKALSDYMGHASITITYDRYGHLMPGNEDEAAGLLDAYLREWTERQARAAQIGA